jgi:hypothetical protein
VFAKPSPSNLESIRLFGYRHVFSPASTSGISEPKVLDNECRIDGWDGNLGLASGLCLNLHGGDVSKCFDIFDRSPALAASYSFLAQRTLAPPS